MGGYCSTRWGYHARRCTVEESLRLCVGDLRSYLADSSACSFCWQWSRDGERIAEVGVILSPLTTEEPDDDLRRYWGADAARFRRLRRTLTLRYAIVRDGQPDNVQQQARLMARPMRFGGFRWWLQCPRCHGFRSILYLPMRAGGRDWRCRTCYGLKYRSQRLDPAGRTELRMQRISSRLHSGWWASWLDFPPPKPKWMRHPTYARHVEAWERASDVREGIYGVRLFSLLTRIERHDATRRR